MKDIWLVYSTFGKRDEAISAARALVEKRLAACVNLHEIASIYRWEGKICEEPEIALIIKTAAATRQAAMDEIRRLHSYRTPCIVAWPLAAGHVPFLQWVADETKPG